MQYLIERIACFADIDTRRAMGFLPGKLPPSNLNLKFDFVPHGIARKIHLSDAISLTLHSRGGVSWNFRGPRWSTVTDYFFNTDGALRVWTLCWFKDSRHPDFNEDGTLKSWQTL